MFRSEGNIQDITELKDVRGVTIVKLKMYMRRKTDKKRPLSGPFFVNFTSPTF